MLVAWALPGVRLVRLVRFLAAVRLVGFSCRPARRGPRELGVGGSVRKAPSAADPENKSEQKFISGIRVANKGAKQNFLMWWIIPCLPAQRTCTLVILPPVK